VGGLTAYTYPVLRAYEPAFTPRFAPLALGNHSYGSGLRGPTVSLHSFRDVTVTLSDADSGKPVASVPFRVHYEYYPADSPIVYHLELAPLGRFGPPQMRAGRR